MLGIVIGVKRDPEFKNDIARRVSQRLGAVSMNFNVNGVVFERFSFLLLESCWVSF